MTLAIQRVTAIVLVRRDTSRVRGRMTMTVPRACAACLPFRQGDICMRHLPLQSDRDLEQQQRGSHPICGSVTHDLERTPLAGMREEAHWESSGDLSQLLSARGPRALA